MPSNPQPIACRPAVFAAFALLALSVSFTPRRAFSQDQPTVVSNVKVEPNPFSPNGDGINETAKFSFSISEASRITIEIVFFSTNVNVAGKQLYFSILPDTLQLGDSQVAFGSDTIYSNTNAAAGLNEFVWNGKIKTLVPPPDSTLIPDSTYTYLIRARNLITQKITKVTGQVTVDKIPPVISAVSAGPNPFSPNNDGINDVTKIKFSLTGLPNNASLGRLGFKTTFNAVTNQWDVAPDPANTDSSGFFDGGSDSVLVPFAPIALQFIKRSTNQGTISFNVRGRRKLDSGDLVLVITGTITINPADPVGTSYRDPNGTLFSVIDQASVAGGTSTISENNTVEVRTSSGAVKVEVRDSQSALVDTSLSLDPPFIGNGTYSAGFGSTTLRPRLDDGNYTYNIVAADESGNLANISGSVTAVSTPISISGLQANPDTISPADANNHFDFSTISYSLNRQANVTLQIFRDSTAFVSNNLVRTVFSNQSQTDGLHNLTWDGKNDAGAYVSPGAEKNYRIIVSAIDPLTAETIEARSQVFVDNKRPETISISRIPTRTSEAGLKVSGRASVGDSVVLFVNSEFTARPLLDEFGTFNATVALGADGLKKLFAHAFDKVWNGPTVSDTQSFVLDTKPPIMVDTLIRVAGQPRSLVAIPPLTKITRRDTIVVRLQDDKEAGVYSGLDLQKTIVRLFRPSGSEVPGTTLFAVRDTVRFVITDSLDVPGTYKLRVTALDSLANRGVDSVFIRLGTSSPAPGLVGVTINPNRNGFFNSRLDNQADWTFTVTLADNSSTGIDTAHSTLKLVIQSTGREVGGSLTKAANTLTLTTSEKIATDGTGDGRYVLQITANDNDPTSDSLTASAAFINDTRPPDTTSFFADANLVRATLSDPGTFHSGVDIVNSRIEVRDVTLQLIQGQLTNDGNSTLYFTFNKPLVATGVYTVTVTALDRAQNSKSTQRLFVVGGISLKPAVTINPGQPTVFPFQSALRAQALTQPLIVRIQVTDVSGSGINWDSTRTRILRPDSTEFTMTSSRSENQLTLTAAGLLSNSGTDDGLYSLAIHIADNSPATADLDTSFYFIFDNRAPDTTAVVFVGDTSQVRLTLADQPAVAGVATAGLDLVGTVIAVTGADGQAVPATTTHDGKSSVTVVFEGGKPSAAGIYTIAATLRDFAGNTRNRSISFPLNVTGRIDFYPPDSSIVTGPLTRVKAWVTGASGGVAPGPAADLTVTRSTQTVPGVKSAAGDSLLYVFTDTLTTSGADDGRYEMRASVDIANLGTRANRTGFFVFDNTPPDTQSVTVTLTDQAATVAVVFTDGGFYPEVAGIDPGRSSAVFEDPRGQTIQPADTAWLDNERLQATFGRLEATGLHYLRLVVADRAGHTATLRKPVINNLGIKPGSSTSIVEDVPARTSARIKFYSGHSGRTITRAVIRIFNLRGDLVRRLDVTDRIEAGGASVSAEWLLENDSGSLVTNGVFIYYWEVTYNDGSTDRIRKTLAVARR